MTTPQLIDSGVRLETEMAASEASPVRAVLVAIP
jgi:hypothetical protein